MLSFTLISALLFLILLMGYLLLLYQYHQAFRDMNANGYPPADYPLQTDPIHDHEPFISVIIAARNEASVIEKCLNALEEQDYPSDKFEVIVVDDHSTDQTAQLAETAGARVIRLADARLSPNTIAFKKHAIDAGIRAAKGEIILTTDADCLVPAAWIRLLSQPLRQQLAVMSIGAVRMKPTNSFLSKFQSIDFAILQGITAAAVHARLHDLASGASLGYTRAAFHKVHGFDGINDIASGDDMLLMQKMRAAYPNGIHFTGFPDAIVDTQTEPDLLSFLRQRIRWASKSGKYTDNFLRLVMATVYGVNLMCCILLITAFFHPVAALTAMVALFIKTLAEWSFTQDVLRYFSLHHLMRLFLFSQPLHIFYTVISGTFGLFGRFTWKGRTVK